jgi:predicted transcriptional regulator
MKQCPHCKLPILNIYEQRALDLVTAKLKNWFTAREFSKKFVVSHQQANNILVKLVNGNLLTRKEEVQLSGGLIYFYKLK